MLRSLSHVISNLTINYWSNELIFIFTSKIYNSSLWPSSISRLSDRQSKSPGSVSSFSTFALFTWNKEGKKSFKYLVQLGLFQFLSVPNLPFKEKRGFFSKRMKKKHSYCQVLMFMLSILNYIQNSRHGKYFWYWI